MSIDRRTDEKPSRAAVYMNILELPLAGSAADGSAAGSPSLAVDNRITKQLSSICCGVAINNNSRLFKEYWVMNVRSLSLHGEKHSETSGQQAREKLLAFSVIG